VIHQSRREKPKKFGNTDGSSVETKFPPQTTSQINRAVTLVYSWVSKEYLETTTILVFPQKGTFFP
jgi:hypothetical protein